MKSILSEVMAFLTKACLTYMRPTSGAHHSELKRIARIAQAVATPVEAPGATHVVMGIALPSACPSDSARAPMH
ncbi:hypothetical protein GCM10027093_72040 [Paraburkholderia jirisanensis]